MLDLELPVPTVDDSGLLLLKDTLLSLGTGGVGGFISNGLGRTEFVFSLFSAFGKTRGL